MPTPTSRILTCLAAATVCTFGCRAQTNPHAQPTAPAAPPLDWKKLEAPVLESHIQLTHRDRFFKAGESYFNPDATWIIFQAVPAPAPGALPDPFYSMYIAKLTRDTRAQITGTEDPILVSPPGSANTCGWFHPTQPWRLLFGSTITPPSSDQKAGFQVGTRKYVWLFPEETEVCTRSIAELMPPQLRESITARPSVHTQRPPADLGRAQPVFNRPQYDAECSWSADGRFILYAHVRDTIAWSNWGRLQPRSAPLQTKGRADADIWVYDTRTGAHHALVTADGYDGGPFFSPDGKRICYRSDRSLNDLLQLFIADLKFDGDGIPVGIEREYQLTDNSQVNWAPFWHPSGRFLVYGSSEVNSHGNYEAFAIEIDEAKLRDQSIRPAESLRRSRLTHADGADILPVFSNDGQWMMWTSQRGPMLPSEQKPSSQVWAARINSTSIDFDAPPPPPQPAPQR